VRDSITTARAGIPSIALVTDAFWPQGDFVANANGMPTVPRVRLPHPVAGSGEDNMARVAADIAPQIIAILTGAAAN
jgi:hypothetical protein